MKDLMEIPTGKLREILELRERLDALTSALNGNGTSSIDSITAPAPVAPAKRGGKRTMGPDARKKIAKAQKLRWRKWHAEKAEATRRGA